MSLLMKALEKAAQDRHQAHAPVTAQHELRMEPLAAAMQAPAGVRRAAAAALNTAADDARSGAQTRAASVLNAPLATSSSPGLIHWMRAYPLYAFGALAGLFLLLYGGYVYLQVAHPDWLRRTQPPLAVSTAPAAVANPAQASAVAATPADTAASSPLPTMQSVFASRSEAPTTPPAREASNATASSFTPPPQPAPPPATPAPTASVPSAAAPAAILIAPRNRIAVSGGDNATPRVNPMVGEAYAALEAGRFETAQRLYHQALRGEPANVDALLGLAAIAQQEHRNDDAQRYFLAILDVEPRHALAQSGLVALMSRADPQAAESRLKQLLAREPSPPLYFNLGNLYAEQGQWPQAQQAYFQAHNLEPRNPDYAYNLAIGLEHLGQQKLALGFYRKALQLSAAKGGANFDGARIQGRVTQLAAQFE